MDLPLARNFKGKETRASAALINANACLKHYTERYKINQLIAEAESAYWRLAIARQIITKRHDALMRAEKIQEWVKKRQVSRLAENEDYLQARAGVEISQLDLQGAMNDERVAALQFNTLRGACQIEVPEKLTSYHDDMFNCLPPSAPCLREDVLAAEQEKKGAIANAIIGIEKNKPDLELYASYALNGNNPSTNQAVSQSFSFNYPTTAFGVRLSMPLDLWQLKKNREGYRKEIMGAKYQFQQKLYESNRLYQEIFIKIQNAKMRLTIAKQLEHIQLMKLQNEKIRFTNGKTTTYQVLLFEQEYANAQASALIIEAELFSLLAELKTFGA